MARQPKKRIALNPSEAGRRVTAPVVAHLMSALPVVTQIEVGSTVRVGDEMLVIRGIAKMANGEVRLKTVPR